MFFALLVLVGGGMLLIAPIMIWSCCSVLVKELKALRKEAGQSRADLAAVRAELAALRAELRPHLDAEMREWQRRMAVYEDSQNQSQR